MSIYLVFLSEIGRHTCVHQYTLHNVRACVCVCEYAQMVDQIFIYNELIKYADKLMWSGWVKHNDYGFLWIYASHRIAWHHIITSQNKQEVKLDHKSKINTRLNILSLLYTILVAFSWFRGNACHFRWLLYSRKSSEDKMKSLFRIHFFLQHGVQS